MDDKTGYVQRTFSFPFFEIPLSPLAALDHQSHPLSLKSLFQQLFSEQIPLLRFRLGGEARTAWMDGSTN